MIKNAIKPNADVPEVNPAALSYVVDELAKEVAFYTEILGMKLLRHSEEFVGNKMVSFALLGYVGAPRSFSIYLRHVDPSGTQNLSWDLIGITVWSRKAIARVKAVRWPMATIDKELVSIESPQGMTIMLTSDVEVGDSDCVLDVCLKSCECFPNVLFWITRLGAKVFAEDNKQVILTFGEKTPYIRFVHWACLPVVDLSMNGCLVLTYPPTAWYYFNSLDTEGRADIQDEASKTSETKETSTTIVISDVDHRRLVFTEENSYDSYNKHVLQEELKYVLKNRLDALKS